MHYRIFSRQQNRQSQMQTTNDDEAVERLRAELRRHHVTVKTKKRKRDELPFVSIRMRTHGMRSDGAWIVIGRKTDEYGKTIYAIELNSNFWDTTAVVYTDSLCVLRKDEWTHYSLEVGGYVHRMSLDTFKRFHADLCRFSAYQGFIGSTGSLEEYYYSPR